jgi:hypothetical protein
MYGGKGANNFDCPLSALGLARNVVMDYNPSNGDALSGTCKIINTVGNSNSENSIDVLSVTGDRGGGSIPQSRCFGLMEDEEYSFEIKPVLRDF